MNKSNSLIYEERGNFGKRINTLFLVNYLNTIVLLALTTFVYTSWNSNSNMNVWSSTVTICSLLIFLYQMLIFYIRKIKFTDFRFWFIVLANIFMFGRVYLNAFGADDQIFWDLMNQYSIDVKYHASLIILINLQSIFMGFMWSSNNVVKNRRLIKFNKKIEDYKIHKLLFNTGIILLFISFPFRLFEDIKAIVLAQSSGSYLAVVSSSGVSDDFAMLFVPAFIFIITGLREKRHKAIFVILIVVLYFILTMILTGDRRYQTTSILTIGLAYIVIYDIKIKTTKIFLAFISTYTFLNLLAAIRVIRIDQLSFFDFLKTFGDYMIGSNGGGIFYETLAEFGLTFFSVTGILKYIPDVIPYQMGLSFYGAVPSILPIGWLFGDFFQSVSISRAINELTNMSVGASLIGDLYANFGMISPLFSFIFGLLISKIFRIELGQYRALSIAQYYSLFFVLINIVRASFMEIFRASMMTYLIPIVIMWLIIQKNKTINTRLKL